MPAALSGDATTAQDGSDFQAGGPDGSVNAELGDRPLGRGHHGGLLRRQVGGEHVVELRGIDRELGGGLRAVPVGYWSGTSAPSEDAVPRACGHLAQDLALVGGERGDEDEPDDVVGSVAALEITAPP